jgi:hypothetical protein
MKRKALPILAVALALPASAIAAPAPVTAGSLAWTQFNVYDTGAPDGADRTWLGYTTSIGPPFTNGSARPGAPATGPTVTTQSPRGTTAGYTTTFPVASGGAFDAASGEGTLEFAGTLTYTSPAHGFTITVSNPLVVIAGGKARLFASGSGSSGSGQSSSAGTGYDRTKPVFDLAIPAGTTTGTVTTFDAVAPAIATADMVWPGGSYPAGSGPDRTPNTFGAFALTIDTKATAAPTPAPKPPQVVQPGTTPAKVGTPKVRCARTRNARRQARTTCTVTTAASVRALVVTFQGRRLARTAVKGGVAKVDLPRKRRRLAFVLQDAKGRELARRTMTVGG